MSTDESESESFQGDFGINSILAATIIEHHRVEQRNVSDSKPDSIVPIEWISNWARSMRCSWSSSSRDRVQWEYQQQNQRSVQQSCWWNWIEEVNDACAAIAAVPSPTREGDVRRSQPHPRRSLIRSSNKRSSSIDRTSNSIARALVDTGTPWCNNRYISMVSVCRSKVMALKCRLPVIAHHFSRSEWETTAKLLRASFTVRDDAEERILILNASLKIYKRKSQHWQMEE